MLFLSTYRNRIDKKNRISVPAPFRAVLAAQQFQGIVAYASLQHRCIEACGMARIMKINERIENLDPYSEERDALATTIFGESVQLSFDGEGRVILPETLMESAGLSDEAVIIGKGEIFELWEPATFAKHLEQARKIALEKRHQLHRGKKTMISHRPVMLDEMLDWLSPEDNGVYIDGTFGAGGYSRAILRAADCHVFAIDRDPSTKRFAEKLEQEFPDRFIWLLGNFCDMCSLVAMHGVKEVDGIVLDLGVSSMQLDQGERGFSFKNDGPLDMRMSQEGKSAADVVNMASEEELADIFYYYGEEKAARKIAHAIALARADEPITRTQQLAEIVRNVVGKTSKTDPATKTFQGLRIHVNHEFESLENGLKAAETMLAPGGRLLVVTFHSLEDRIVKRFTHSRCGKLGEHSRHLPERAEVADAPAFFLPKPEKRVASDAEVAENPRSRSATMRMMIRAAEEKIP